MIKTCVFSPKKSTLGMDIRFTKFVLCEKTERVSDDDEEKKDVALPRRKSRRMETTKKKKRSDQGKLKSSTKLFYSVEHPE